MNRYHHQREVELVSLRRRLLLIEGVLLGVLLAWLLACLLFTTLPPGALYSGFATMLSGAVLVPLLAYQRKRKIHQEAVRDGDGG